jgi:hypothetical protein
MTNASNSMGAGIPESLVQDLGERFGFDALRPDIGRELNHIAKRYARDLRLFDNAAEMQAQRTNYRALREQAESFRNLLASPEFEDLGSEIYLTLRTTLPESGVSYLPVPNGDVGEHVLQLLDNLLSTVFAAANNVEQRNSPIKGRKPDFALECLVRNIAYLWTDTLNRPFRLDYHKGSVLTEAAEFVITIANCVAPEVSQTRLITTMRTIIREQNSVPPVK